MNFKKCFILGAFLCSIITTALGINVTKMTCEFIQNPLALDTQQPRFGWQMRRHQQNVVGSKDLALSENGCMQSAYELEVYTIDKGEKAVVWNSGINKSSQSQLVSYQGPTLKPLTRYFWRVKVWDEKDQASSWSSPAEFRIAPSLEFLNASWIGAINQEQAQFPSGRNYHGSELKKPTIKAAWNKVDSMAYRSICLRKEFNNSKEISDATVYICGLGHYELSLNGTKIGDGEFTPLWSDYDKTVYYNTYDVTSQLKKGANAIGVLLGNGFYNVVGGNRYCKLQIGFGPETLFFKMLIRYTDGTQKEIVSDCSWKYALSPITFNSIYGGEDYDARLEQEGWNKAGFNDTSWTPVVVQESPKGSLQPQQMTPIKIMKRYEVQQIHKLTAEEVKKASKSTKRTVDESAILLDMGQNLSGFPEITVRGKRGQKITLLVAEAVVDSCNAANQRQTGRQHYYTYTIKGNKNESWHPRFAYYGFRYIQVEGAVLKGDKNPKNLPVIQQIQSCFVHNSAADVSTFECSNQIFTSAHNLIHNAVRSNMQSVFTDCPHREKLGWLEQVHLNGPGLLYNYDLSTYYPKIMQDMADSQRANGMIPTTAPQYVIFEGPGMDVFADSPEWGSAFVIVPFMYYDTYGDDSLIRKYYHQIRAYVDYLSSRAQNNLIDFGLGDWYDYGNFRAGFSRNTPVGLVASAQYYMDLIYIAEAAQLVGNHYDAVFYKDLSEKVKKAFNQKYLNNETCQYGTGSQCSNALPLFLNMVPDDKQQTVLENLVKDIKAHGTRLTTGDVGNRYLFQTLARNGLNDLMYDMHNHKEAPGYGFQLKFGATTLTEQWDPRQGSSWNHFMMGQIDEWFFNSLVGLQPNAKEKGYKNCTIRPQIVGDLKEVKASYETLYGTISIAWTHENGLFTLHVTIPANCTANIYLPADKEPQLVKSGTYTFNKKI